MKPDIGKECEVAKGTNARRYAQAVFQIALERDELDRWQSDLARIAGLGEDGELVTLFENPKIPFSDKQKLLAGQLGGINPLALNLVYLLVNGNCLGLTGQIADEYQQLLNSHRGMDQAEVITAVPIDEEDKTKLEERLGAVVGKKVVVRAEVDPDLIGGIVARIGGKLIDGSSRSRLEILKEQIGGKRR